MPSSNLQIVDSPPHATWGEARKLVDKVRAGARAWLELGEVLESLRAEFFKAGSGRRNDLKPAPHDAAKVEKGWQAKVREELGISDDTARRWMLDAQRHQQMRGITEGTVLQIEGQRVTDEVRERAQEALSALAADPSARPARLWAGVWGGAKTKGVQRKATDHAMNISNAIAKLKTSLPHWRSIAPDERAFIEKEFLAMKHLLEGTLQ
jgi:hypothetical protein